MYSFMHRYHHPEGNPVARLLNSYTLLQWETLMECFFVPNLEPKIEHFKSSDNIIWDEIVYSWETKEKYEEWLAVSGTDWQIALTLGLEISELAGVTQVRGEPDYDVGPSDGMIATTIDDLMLAYAESQSQ